MEKITVKFKKLHPDAITPTYGTAGAAGFDFYAIEDLVLKPGETQLVKTGLTVAIPQGYEIQVRPRSGMSLKTPFRVTNAPGTIDADYRGEICIIGQNIDSASDLIVEKGDRIAQGVLAHALQGFFEEVDELDNTQRGSGGFGSTGTK